MWKEVANLLLSINLNYILLVPAVAWLLFVLRYKKRLDFASQNDKKFLLSEISQIIEARAYMC